MTRLEKPLKINNIQGDGFVLRPFAAGDEEQLQQVLNDKRVARDVSNIPFPYTQKDAAWWVSTREDSVTPLSERVDFVVDVDGVIAGSVAFINLAGHKAQLSCWINPLYWRQGLAEKSLKLLIEFGFTQLDLLRIYAYHYPENIRTAGLLEKLGLTFEGVHEKEWCKVIDGKMQLFDSNYYSIVRDTASVKSVAILAATGKHYDHAGDLAAKITAALEKAGCSVERYDGGEVTHSYDVAIAVGGDGTVMRSVTTFSPLGIPTISINAGDVGFLTNAEAADWEVFVERILAGDYTVERRMALRFEWKGKAYGPFANEVLLRHPEGGIAQFAVKLGKSQLFQGVPADGLLVATQTGSTAYNASAGGPIVMPGSPNVVVINALNPPIFNMRPVISEELARGGSLMIEVKKSKHDAPLMIAADTTIIKDGPQVGETITISRHPQPMLLGSFGSSQFTDALKRKMSLAD